MAVVHDEIIDFLVEQAGAHQTDALEVVFGAEVEVVAECRVQIGVTEGDVFLVDDDVGYEVGILGSCQRVGERSAEFQVVVHVILDEHRRQHVDVALRLFGRLGVALVLAALLAVVVDIAAVSDVGILQTQTSHQVPFLAQLLVEADVTGADCFVCLVVLAHLVVLDFLFELVGVGQVEAANIFLLHEVSYLIAVAAHVSVAVFVL